MKVKRITIENVGSIESLELEPGAITVLEGRNGVGKTSVLTAIEAVIAGGHDPSVIRKGAEKAVVVVDLDDGTAIRRSVTEKASNLTITTKDGDKKAAPKTYLEKLVDTAGWNPAKFLEARPAERVSMLLAALPIRADRDALARLMKYSGPLDPIQAWPIGVHPLDGIARVRKALYDERTFVARAERQKAAHIEELRRTAPAVDGDSRGALSAALAEAKTLDDEAQARKLAIVAAEADRVGEINRQLAARLATLQDNKDRGIDALRALIAELERKIALHRETIDAEMAAAKDEASGGTMSAFAASKEAREALAREQEPRRIAIMERIGEAREKVRAQAQAEEAAAIIRSAEEERARNEKTAAELTQLLQAVDAFRDAALVDLPIPGVLVADGEVYVADPAVSDGAPLPWPRVNRSRQVRIAVDVARLRAGELGLIVLDEAECLDPETWREFVDAAAAAGGQVIAARVSDDLVLRVSDGGAA